MLTSPFSWGGHGRACLTSNAAGGVIPRIDEDGGTGPRIGFLEGCRIEELTTAGWSGARIASLLARAKSSISRELARCPAGRYQALTANSQAVKAKKRQTAQTRSQAAGRDALVPRSQPRAGRSPAAP